MTETLPPFGAALDKLSLGDLTKLFERMFDDYSRQAEMAIERRAAHTAFTTAKLAQTPAPKRAIISLKGRVGRRSATLYVTRVSYSDKPEASAYSVSRIGYAEDRSKALEFTQTCATGVALYLARCGYTPAFEAKESL